MKSNRNFNKFEDWHSHDIIQLLQIKRIFKSDALQEWLKTSALMPTVIQDQLEPLRYRLELYHSEWNEDELKFQFIAPFIQSIHFWGEKFGQYSQRSLVYRYGEIEVNGVVDWMAAYGGYAPQKPYFFLHEYKKSRYTTADPLGQVLIAMLAAQQINADQHPVYGCYVVGKLWTFVILEPCAFSESKAYDVSDPDEFAFVWLVLQKTRDIIDKI